MDHEQAFRKLGHTPQGPDGHYPNAPLKKSEPIQCVKCLKTWPCEYHLLSK